MLFLQTSFAQGRGKCRWAQGAPGLLLRSNGTDINQFCDVGVFIGELPKNSKSISEG